MRLKHRLVDWLVLNAARLAIIGWVVFIGWSMWFVGKLIY